MVLLERLDYILLIELTFCSCILLFVLRGFVLREKLQQGQLFPSHFTKIAHTEQRFCPVAYLPELEQGLSALNFIQVPLQVIKQFKN